MICVQNTDQLSYSPQFLKWNTIQKKEEILWADRSVCVSLRGIWVLCLGMKVLHADQKQTSPVKLWAVMGSAAQRDWHLIVLWITFIDYQFLWRLCGYSSNARPSNSQSPPPPPKSVTAMATYFVLKVNEPHFQVVLSHNPAGWVTSVNPPCQHAPLHDWVPRETARHALWQLHQHYQVCWEGTEQKLWQDF